MEPFVLIPVAESAISERMEETDVFEPPATPMPECKTETFEDVMPILPPLEQDFVLSDDDEEMDTATLPCSIDISNVPMDSVPSTTSVQPSANQKRKIDWQEFKIPKKPRIPSKYFERFPKKRKHPSEYLAVVSPHGKTVKTGKLKIPIRLPSKVDKPFLKPISWNDRKQLPPFEESSSKTARTAEVVKKREHPSEALTVVLPHGKTEETVKPISTHKADKPQKKLLQPTFEMVLNGTTPSEELSLIKPKKGKRNVLHPDLHPDLHLFKNERESALKISPEYTIQKRDNCQLVRHYKMTVALCVLANGFTITDGRTAIAKDLESDSAIIAKSLAFFAPSIVILVGERAKYIWNVIQTSYAKEFAGVQMRAFKTKYSFGKCKYCHKEQCHRWKAVVGGMGRWMRVPIPPIEH